MGKPVGIDLPVPGEESVRKYRERLGVELSPADATARATGLMQLVFLLTHPPDCPEAERMFRYRPAGRRKGRRSGT